MSKRRRASSPLTAPVSPKHVHATKTTFNSRYEIILDAWSRLDEIYSQKTTQMMSNVSCSISLNILIKLSKNASMPRYGSHGSAGLDLTSTGAYSIAPGERQVISTGVSMSIPDTMYKTGANKFSLIISFLFMFLCFVFPCFYIFLF